VVSGGTGERPKQAAPGVSIRFVNPLRAEILSAIGSKFFWSFFRDDYVHCRRLVNLKWEPPGKMNPGEFREEDTLSRRGYEILE
jgi:hypothetical protein